MSLSLLIVNLTLKTEPIASYILYGLRNIHCPPAIIVLYPGTLASPTGIQARFFMKGWGIFFQN